MNIFTQIWNGAKCGLDIHHWGIGLAVTGRIRDIGQNVVKSTFQTGASNIPHLLANFLPYRIPVLEIQYNNYSMKLCNYHYIMHSSFVFQFATKNLKIKST